MADQLGKTKGQLARDAILFYLNHYERLKEEENDRLYVVEMKRMANRMAGMLRILQKDVGTLFELHKMAVDPAVLEEAATLTESRLKKKLDEQERSIVKRQAKVLKDDVS